MIELATVEALPELKVINYWKNNYITPEFIIESYNSLNYNKREIYNYNNSRTEGNLSIFKYIEI